jgi:hypothetical protein
MERSTDDHQREYGLTERYHVSQQDIAAWKENGHTISDIEWALRFAETSPDTDTAKLLDMRRSGMTWDQVRESLGLISRGSHNPAEEASGRKLVPGGKRHESRYFYRSNARLIDEHDGAHNRSGYEGSPAQVALDKDNDNFEVKQATSPQE